jgi:hypothetical protein
MNKLFIIFFILISCKNIENEVSPITISVIPEKAVSLDLKEIFEDLDYVYLSPSGNKGFIGEFSKILYDGESFFVFQNGMGESSICKFDRTGKLIFQEVSKTEGPGKYMGASDIVLDNEKGVIEVLDSYQSKIVVLSKNDGAFINEMKLSPYNFKKFAKLEKNKYALYTANQPTELGAYNIYINQHDGQNPKHYVAINPYLTGTSIDENCFSSTPLNKSYLYTGVFSNIAWRVSLDTVMKAYRVDFGNKWFDEKTLQGLPGSDTEGKMNILNTGDDKITSIRNIEEFENSIFFHYFFSNNVYWNFYNKQNKSLISFHVNRAEFEKPNNFDSGPIPVYHYAVYNDYMVLGTKPTTVYDLGQAAPANSKFKQFAQTVPEEGNPVIILAKLKEKYR